MIIEEKVKSLLIDVLDVDASLIHYEAQIVEDLGASESALMSLPLAIEDEFGISIPGADAELFVSVGAIIEYLEAHV